MATWYRPWPIQSRSARPPSYTWSLLFAGMDALLPEALAEGFDYWQEASSRWDWTRAKLEHPDLGTVIATASSA